MSAVGLVLATHAPALAAGCPPLDEGLAGLAVLGPATTSRKGPRSQATLWPPSGPAPLRVGVLWRFGHPDPPPMVEIDADGDGVVDVSDTREENLGYTFRTPGQFRATVRVRETDGTTTTSLVPITVFTLAAFDAELQGRWAALKAALSRGDLVVAEECVHSAFRHRYDYDLRSLARRPREIEADPPPSGSARFTSGRRCTTPCRPTAARPTRTRSPSGQTWTGSGGSCGCSDGGRRAVRTWRLMVLLTFVATAYAAGWPHVSNAEGPWRGQVVDAETGQPLEGVVVLGVWDKLSPGAVHRRREFYDVDEVVTDAEGRFVLPARSLATLNPLVEIEGPQLHLFKGGYGRSSVRTARGLPPGERE